MKRLQKLKESAVRAIVDSLPERLSAEGLENLRRHIKDRMKRKMKMSTHEERS